MRNKKAIEELGGVRKTARTLNVPVSTVWNWTRNGIPTWRWPAVEAALAARDDFADLTPGGRP